ncbi:NmrA-like family protein [Ampelomyces quisqualis]|uniref:NmrA-like family protein n=1 Tax=Ampelomyces quisqualis TaxID=50730 RepID=A0A6A5R2J1_AMPQU|nr:NmrA-like family protein [Ampelomyces quisqualis]
MAPTFLIVGATGNTGRNVVQTLSDSLQSSDGFSEYRILALTRSTSSSAAQELAKLPHVQVLEQTWTEITADWLRSQNVERAFIASHNEPTQFADESTFHLNALHAGVKYVVRISTTAANVTPDCAAYYPRQHWAIEQMLSAPEFKNLHWSSLQPNVFTTFWLGPAVEFVKEFRKTGKQGTLDLMASSDAQIGIIHPDDVGTFAAKLLLDRDTPKHNKAKYVLNGPEDITGAQIVEMVEKHIGTKVEQVNYKQVSFVEQMAEGGKYSKNVILSIKHAPETSWDGKATASTTSPEVLQIAAPKITPAEVFETLLQG